MRNPVYKGQPDAFSPTDALSVGADGGGDVDIAVGNGPAGPYGVPTIAFSSLVAGNVSTERSQDLGNSFTKNPAGNISGGIPVDDREWQAFYGKNDVYILYRTLEPAISQIQHSTDGGLTYGVARTAGQIGQAGSIDVDQHDGTVYASGSSGQVAVGIPDPLLHEPITYNVYQAATDPNGVASLFFIVKVGPDGIVYGAYSNGQHVFLISSKDHGKTWSKPVRVDNGGENRTAIFPALVAGPVPGSVAVAWYGTSSTSNTDSADWKVFAALSLNAADDTPTFRQQVVSDHYIHNSNISLGGTLGNANRNLLDYFQISFDPVGALVVDYTDDHNDFNGHTYVAREVVGQNAYGKKLATPTEGNQLPPRQPLSYDGSQVVDFPRDVAEGLLAVVPTVDPLDILAIKYSAAKDANGNYVITARMKVSDLSSIPALSTWRMNFAVNCPYSTLNGTRLYSNAASDRGAQFWVAANTDQTGTQTFTYGTAVRNSDGTITYTTQGAADSGAFDPVSQTITVNVSASKLNPFIKWGLPIHSGTIMAGLRGSTFTASADARRDSTRGGTQYVIP
jgi:hypothetical protein